MLPCPNQGCGRASAFMEVGTATGRPRYQCPSCGPWVRKNEAAVALGRLGGQASMAALSEAERKRRATKAAETRWREERLAQNAKPGKPR